MPEAVVIGSGPNGLAGAILLAENGYRVEVHEAEPEAGGGARTAELTLTGFRHDLCSAIHPFGRASPAFAALRLGVDWVDPPGAPAHPLVECTVVLHTRYVVGHT